MKIFKLAPVLVLLAFLKLLFTGAYFYAAKTGRLSWPSALALAETKKETPPACPEDVFRALRTEKERLAAKEEEINRREKSLNLLEEQVKKRLASLTNLEEEIDKKLAELRTIKSQRFKLLVGAYANMKPSKAAKLLEAMEPEMAIKILSALKTEQVARILSAMPPEKAASLAESLSGLPPREL